MRPAAFRPPNSSLSLVDPDLYSSGDPHAVWRWLRQAHPVWWHEPIGFWAVTSYQLAKRVLSDWQDFSSTNGTSLRPDLSTPYPGGGKMLVLTDPPRHTEIRRAIAQVFAPRTVARLAEAAGITARSVLGAALDQGSCDFVTDVAGKLTLPVSAAVLSIPADEVPAMSALAFQAAAGAGSDSISAAVPHHEIMLRFFRLIRDRYDSPADDLIGAFVGARRAGLAITDEEILLTCDNIVVAATETAVRAASGGILALLQRPDAWNALRNGLVTMSSAVEEILRWTTPGTHLLRTVVRDTTIGDVTVRAGEAVAVWLPSANRDEAVFSNGEEFTLDRQPNPHLTFGAGAHFCLGAALARIVLSALLTALVSLPGRMTIARQPRYNSSWFGWGLSSLSLTFAG